MLWGRQANAPVGVENHPMIIMVLNHRCYSATARTRSRPSRAAFTAKCAPPLSTRCRWRTATAARASWTLQQMAVVMVSISRAAMMKMKAPLRARRWRPQKSTVFSKKSYWMGS